MESVTVAEKPKARSGAAAGSVEHSGSLARGSCIDRYVVIDPLGQGGMGVVYAVYDPKLDRRVAIKLLRVDRGHRAGTERARQRLLREAQALAQLAHPNVVAVYDVGTFGDNVFMAMELVEGRTLRQLLVGGKQPSWRELLTMLIAAGRGLAAAHRAGLIHRDVKPDNIVLGNDGRVRMLDFGLARTADLDHEDEPAGESGESPPAPADLLDSGQRQLRSPLTEQGSVLGTPAYMAPEQEDGRAVDAACDQFSFCVTVYEALYGHLPGKHESSDGAPASARVPAWVRRILVRGMSAPPQERFPSMEALLDALARDPGARRRRLLAAAGFAATVAAATLLFMRAMPTRLC
ncbi:MAG: serine/threonine-protein kinase, partial [Polyangia bacterium]